MDDFQIISTVLELKIECQARTQLEEVRRVYKERNRIWSMEKIMCKGFGLKVSGGAKETTVVFHVGRIEAAKGITKFKMYTSKARSIPEILFHELAIKDA